MEQLPGDRGSWTSAGVAGKGQFGPPREARRRYGAFVAQGGGSRYAPWEELVSQIYLGGEGFRKRAQGLVSAPSQVPQLQRLPARPRLSDIIDGRLLRFMENFHFQFSAITAQRTGGGTGLMFALAARELEEAASKDRAATVLTRFLTKLRERLPSSAEFALAFGELQYTAETAKQQPLITYLLIRLDQHMRKHGAVDYERMSIEHIGSQNPKSGEPPAPTNVGRIGNLILVPRQGVSGLRENLAEEAGGVARGSWSYCAIDSMVPPARKSARQRTRKAGIAGAVC